MDKGILELNCIFVKNRLIFFKAPLNAPKRFRRQNGLKEREKLANREKKLNKEMERSRRRKKGLTTTSRTKKIIFVFE